MNLDLQDLILFAPIILCALTAVAVMLTIALRRHHGAAALVAMIGLGATLAVTLWLLSGGDMAHGGSGAVTPLFFIDRVALFFMALIGAIALVSAALCYSYIDSYPGLREELYILLPVAATGAMALTAASHLAALFLGLELLSVPLYGLVAYTRNHRPGLEAGVKYLVLSAAASAFLLFGIALIYAETGAMGFQKLAQFGPRTGTLMLLGSGMMLVAIAFKLSLAPFHLWTPDVYQGAPAPVGSFLATASKLAVFAMFLRFLMAVPATMTAAFHALVLLLALVSILVGNLLALTQTNVKRLLGYSSVAHFGYLLLAVVANREASFEAVLVYLLVYAVATLGAFAVLSQLSAAGGERDTDELADLRGLFWRRPGLGAAFALMMLSLAGIPFTGGFIGKFVIFSVGVQAELWLALGIMVIGSAIGVFYYLRVLVTLFRRVAVPAPGLSGAVAQHWTGGVIVATLFVLTLGFGVYPQPVFDLIQYVIG